MGARAAFIRDRALALLHELAGATGEAVPDAAPLEDLAELVCGLTAFDDPSLDPRVNGELNTAIGSIRLRSGMAQSRRRFVIAHELGHWALEGAEAAFWQDDERTIDERPSAELEREGDVLRAYNTRERHEQEANLFALELLVPAPRLWAAVSVGDDWSVDELAGRFGVSPDALLSQLINVCCYEPVTAADSSARPAAAPVQPNPEQLRAIDAPLPLLVVAGPGTGKTRSIVAKYLQLVEAGVDPAAILALTFSNKAAEEMRARIVKALLHTHPDLAGRVEISTFHAWGLNFLRSYGPQIGLPLDVKLADKAAVLTLLARRIEELPLEQYKMPHQPTYYLSDLAGFVSRAKDELCTPEQYRALAGAEAERLVQQSQAETAGKTTKKAEEQREKAGRDGLRLRELGAIYTAYELMLRDAGVLDFGDLVMRSVELLRRPAVAAELRERYDAILVDEYQDINYGMSELVRLLDGGRGRVWAVGDPWQSIYRFRGASPVALATFEQVYPGAHTLPLEQNYRSFQAILDAGHALMAPDPAAPARRPLRAARGSGAGSHVVEWAVHDEAAEVAAIAHDILRRTGGRLLRRTPCARRLPRNLRRCSGLASGRLRARRPRWAEHAVLCRTQAQAARVAAALEAHGVPIDATSDLFEREEIKDLLAVCASVRRVDSAAMLRLLAGGEHAVPPGDLELLIRLAAENRKALARAVRDPELVAQLGADVQQRIGRLLATLETLAHAGDAWQVLTRYVFALSRAMRERLARSARREWSARRELAAIGRLIVVALNFVAQAPPAARGAPAFISYLRLLLEVGEGTRAEFGGAGDAVRVMTVHQAKGLEFPYVYVPFLAANRFPPRAQGSPIPALPAMLHGRPVDELQEERYLLYVAMTRAQDRLVLSRALFDAEHRPVERSPLLTGAGDPAPWPLRELELQRSCAGTQPASRLRVAPALKMPVSASSIETYGACPRRFLYQYGYQLYDNSSPFLRMHQTIRDAASRLGELSQVGGLPQDEQSLNDLVFGIFARHELAEVVYAGDYFREALEQSRDVWNDLRSGTITAGDIRPRFVLRRPAAPIELTVDRVDDGPNGPRWVRMRSGREKDDDRRETRLMLYAQAYEDAYGASPEMAIHYTRSGRVVQVRPTDDMRKRHLDKVDGWLRDMLAGAWEPNPGSHCATCPFNLICPI